MAALQQLDCQGMFAVLASRLTILAGTSRGQLVSVGATPDSGSAVFPQRHGARKHEVDRLLEPPIVLWPVHGRSGLDNSLLEGGVVKGLNEGWGVYYTTGSGHSLDS
jgi:hypothetical protein